MNIPVNRGQVVLIDDDDFPLLDGLRIQVRWDTKSLVWRAHCYGYEKRKAIIYGLARLILGLGKGNKLEAEHIDPNATLDNRRSNLRIATRAQNNANRRMRKDNTSGYKGVVPYGSGFRAQIQVNGKGIALGTRATKEEAYELYCEAARRLHGDFARPERKQDVGM